jgi:hypothetical protein
LAGIATTICVQAAGLKALLSSLVAFFADFNDHLN